MATTSDSDYAGGLSARGDSLAKTTEFLHKYSMTCVHDAFDPVNNPMGYVNMGTATNELCGDLWLERLNQPEAFRFDLQMQSYFSMSGITKFRESLARLFSQQLDTPQPVDPNHLFVLNGVLATLDACAFCLGSPGDVFLTPVPAYVRLFNSCHERAAVELVGVPLQAHSEGQTVPFQLTASILEQGVREQIDRGKKVKAILMVNPNNPLGEVYSPELMMDIINMCQRYNLHLIVDEVYAMSVYDKSIQFHSVLKFSSLPNPERVHMVWGFSKDFGLPGLRIGVIHTLNKDFMKALKNYCLYQAVPSCVQETAADVLNDTEWLEKTYFVTNYKRLLEAYTVCKNRLEALRIPCKPAQAGLFIWADFSQHLRSLDEEGEQELFQRLYQRKLYIVPGNQLYSSAPGWFRITFAIAPQQLGQGLHILEQVLKEAQLESK